MAGGVYGYSGWAKVGTAAMHVMPGGRMDRPRNIFAPPPNANRYGPANYAEGVRFPVVRLPLVVHPTSGAYTSWFTAANLNAWFLTRSGATNDLAAVASDMNFGESSLGQHKVVGVKGARFSLNTRFGQNPLVADMEFHGLALASPAGAPAPLTHAPCTFASVTLGGTFASVGIIGVTVDLQTGLTPNEELSGANVPSEHNADAPGGFVTIMQYAKPDILPPGYVTADTYEELRTADGSEAWVQVKINDTGPVYTRLTFTRLVLVNPNQRQTQQGRVVRQFQYQMFPSITAYCVEASSIEPP